MDSRIYDFPTSSIMFNGKRINYYDFIKSKKNKQCEQARKEIEKKIDITKIDDLIDSIDMLALNHKKFLKTVIRRRFDEIIK